MARSFKSLLENKPRWFDAYIRMRTMMGKTRASHDFLNTFSRSLGKKVRFIQIGANDGLRNDPIREFVVRDRWCGVFVEPLPAVFELLKRNYRYLNHAGLSYTNAAVSDTVGRSLKLWTFKEDFLAKLPSLGQRMRYLRKSSLDPGHLRRFVPDGASAEDVLEQITIPCLTVSQLVKKYELVNEVDLLVIDAEGHESVIIPSLDFNVLKPRAIFFESDHLGDRKKSIYDFLGKHGYKILEVRSDTIAQL